MKKLDYHARLIVHGLPTMNKKTLTNLISWLRREARDFSKESKDLKIYSKKFTATLMKCE